MPVAHTKSPILVATPKALATVPLLAVGFEIETAFGGNRRDYVDVKDARDAFLYVCKKIN